MDALTPGGPDRPIDLGDLRLECRRLPAARPGLPTLVLLHEGLGSVAMWRNFPAQLAMATGCAVLIYSRRGYGGSDAHAPPWGLDYMHREAQDILPRILAAEGIDQAILIGHSDGASIAAIHAGSDTDGRVCGLVLIAPHLFVEEICLTSIQAAKRAYEDGPLRFGLSKYHGANVDHAFWGWNGAWLDPDFGDWDIRGFLPGIQVPTLVLQGAEDEYGTEAQLDAVVDGVSGPVTKIMLPNCRHSPHKDQPESTVGHIANLVSRASATH
ncbi:MAG: alpha/beta fold hydrolase [Magnetospiraceae bacterium]